MAVIGSLVASLSLESASFISGMKKAAEETSRTQKAIQANLDRITTGVQTLASVLAVDFFAQAAKAALDYSDAIADLADRTGASTKFIQEFGYAAQLAGSDVETARAGLEKFAKLVGEAANGSESARKKLAEYGVTSLDVDRAVGQASDAIAKMDNPTKQLAATTELFGKKAATLTQTLAGGTEGLALQARAARDLGIVLEDSVVRNAGQANDKLDTMKMILDAKMAATIAQNAESIVSLANGIMTLTGAIVGFLGSNPQEAYTIIGALAGARVGGGWGALAGGAAGFIAGGLKKGADRAASNDLTVRTDALKEITDRVNRARETNNRAALKPALGQLQQERERMSRALANQPRPNLTPSMVTDETIGLPKAATATKRGPSAAEIAQKEAERAARYASDILRGQMDIIRSGGVLDTDADLDYYRQRLDWLKPQTGDLDSDITINGYRLDATSRQRQEALLGGNIDIQYDNTRREIAQRAEEQLRQLEQSVQRGDVMAGAEEGTLKAQILYQKLLDENAAAWEHRVERDRQSAESELNQLAIQQDALSLQSSIAETARERRRIALQMLDIETRARDKALEAAQIGSDPNSQRYKDIQAQRDALKAQSGLMRDSVMKSTMGPIESYLDTIPDGAERANEALQSIAVEGLTAVSDGIAEALLNWENFGESFENVAKQIIKSLLQMAVNMAIIQPIGQVLGGAFGIPMKANGGLSSGGITLVGERGPEIVDLPAGSNVIPNHALSSVSSGSGGTVINVDARGSTDEALVQQMVVQGIARALPQLNASATANTYRKLGRPTM